MDILDDPSDSLLAKAAAEAGIPGSWRSGSIQYSLLLLSAVVLLPHVVMRMSL